MKRLTLVALKTDEERVMQRLQSLAAVQVIETADASLSEETLACAQSDVLKLNTALGLLKPYAKKPSFLEAKPEVTLEALREAHAPALDYSEKLETADREKAALRARIEKNHALIDTLLPFIKLDVKLSQVRPTKSTTLFMGLIANEDLPRLEEGLPEDTARDIYTGEKQAAVVLLTPKESAAQINAFIKELKWTDVALPALDMTAAGAMDEAQEDIRRLTAQIDELTQAMVEIGKNRAQLAGAADAAAIACECAEAKNTLIKTEATFVLNGWVREDQTEIVRAEMQKLTDACYIEFRDPVEEDGVPPVAMKNIGPVKPYEAVTRLYSPPVPGSIDGTPFMAPFYFLLFGMMLSDTGYGLVLTLGCLFFIKKAKPAGMMGDIARVIMWGGVSTVFWGFLVGTFFGMDWNRFFCSVGTALFRQDWSGIFYNAAGKGLFPLIVDPNSDPINMLILCFGLGIVHIFFGVGVKMYMCFRTGDWQTAIFDNFSWFLIVFGLILFAALPALSTVGMVTAIIGALMVLLFKGRGKKVTSRAVSGLAGLYDITSYLSDILSYARLFALGIATGVIGSVFNDLVGMIMGAGGNIIVRILLFIIGAALLVALHLFNVGINTLGTFVHCARLQFVEFYGKFYEAGGHEFKPLAYRTRHTRVLQSE
ncbi:MAG: V-type ATP synthase subunit I [Clostridiales bacterium]|jgi:V/A-type H+-transporting ATPase subunit I|nr:V-type ATP synthase subunit I [Clostridiales bacterium]